MYLNLKQSDYDRYVYRITTIDRVQSLFESCQNTLVKPKLWDDPFENFILNSKVRHKSGEICKYNYHESIYGQCWTFHKASDAMWRIYAPGKNGVRLRSTIRDLANGLHEAHPAKINVKYRVGRVRYLPSKKMRKVANSTFDDDGIATDKIFKSLLVKRPAFKHERELRLLYFDVDRSNSRNDKYDYAVDPHAMISQIMVDPRLPLSDANSMIERIRTDTGFSGSIKRSLLYAPPQEEILDVSEANP